MAQFAYTDKRHWFSRGSESLGEMWTALYSYFRYDLFGKQRKKVTELAEDVQAEMQVVVGRSSRF